MHRTAVRSGEAGFADFSETARDPTGAQQGHGRLAGRLGEVRGRYRAVR